MGDITRAYFTKEQIDKDVKRIAQEIIMGRSSMTSDTSHFENYLDSRFASIEGKIDGHIAAIDQRVTRIDEDVREIRSDIKELRNEVHTEVKEMRHELHKDVSALKYWIVGTAISLAALFISIVGYQTMVMQFQSQARQSQMRV